MQIGRDRAALVISGVSRDARIGVDCRHGVIGATDSVAPEDCGGMAPPAARDRVRMSAGGT
ncbi:hypothetical protein, partial [Staphylococcus aureus]